MAELRRIGDTARIRGILRSIEGDACEREGLAETPQRVVKSWGELYSGYDVDVPSLFKTFDAAEYSEMVLVKEIELYSTCEHHMLPFIGKCHIAYIPQGRIVGVSKVVRVMEAYARRLQIQERICKQVTAALDEHLDPLGSACIIEAQHLCMRMRGVSKQNSVMVTSSLTGLFLSDPAVRSELFHLIALKGG